MHDVSKIEPRKWARYKAKCAEFAPHLTRLHNIFTEIAAASTTPNRRTPNCAWTTNWNRFVTS
jgi:hypothetical protein